MHEEPTHPDDGTDREMPGRDDQTTGDAAVNETTGDAAVDEALRTLHGLDAMPVHQHAQTIEDVHGVLRDRLADEQVDSNDDGQG